MVNNELINKIKSIPNGRFFRITYMTEPKLSADAKRNGVEVLKITEKTVRTGVEYRHIRGVVAAGVENQWGHSVVKNKVIKHNTKDSYYLSVAPIRRGGNTKTTWLVNGIERTEQEVKDSGYVLDSYWKSSSPVVQLINFDHVLGVK